MIKVAKSTRSTPRSEDRGMLRIDTERRILPRAVPRLLARDGECSRTKVRSLAPPNVSTRMVPETDRAGWDRVVDHPLQTWAWGDFRQKTGVEVVRLGIYKNKALAQGSRPELVEGWQLTFHRLPCLPWTIGYFPKGPEINELMIKELSKVGREKRAIFIQIEPNTHPPAGGQISLRLRSGRANLTPSHHPLFPRYTFILDLTRSEDELLSSMHPKTRYNLRLAQKHGVVVKEDNSEKAFATYLKLTQETLSRQKFYAHNPSYHRRMWQVLSQSGIAHLFTASYQSQILATWIVFIWKDTIYYPYGASSRAHREMMAPNLLLWEIARWAKQKGIKFFDLWGALGPQPNEKDPWFGFHRFKEGYRPQLVEFMGSYDLIINPFLYRLSTMADSFRWLLLHIRTKF